MMDGALPALQRRPGPRAGISPIPTGAYIGTLGTIPHPGDPGFEPQGHYVLFRPFPLVSSRTYVRDLDAESQAVGGGTDDSGLVLRSFPCAQDDTVGSY